MSSAHFHNAGTGFLQCVSTQVWVPMSGYKQPNAVRGALVVLVVAALPPVVALPPVAEVAVPPVAAATAAASAAAPPALLAAPPAVLDVEVAPPTGPQWALANGEAGLEITDCEPTHCLAWHDTATSGGMHAGHIVVGVPSTSAASSSCWAAVTR